MKCLSKYTILAALLFCTVIPNSHAKENPQIEAIVSSDSISVDLAYQICGGCDDPFDKSFCNFSGDICTELLAPLELNYSFLGCLNDRSDGQSAEATIQDLAKLADYLFRDSKQLTCDDVDFLSASQILDGVTVVTLTEVISGLFERAEAVEAEN